MSTLPQPSSSGGDAARETPSVITLLPPNTSRVRLTLGIGSRVKCTLEKGPDPGLAAKPCREGGENWRRDEPPGPEEPVSLGYLHLPSQPQEALGSRHRVPTTYFQCLALQEGPHPYSFPQSPVPRGPAVQPGLLPAGSCLGRWQFTLASIGTPGLWKRPRASC